MDEDQDKIRKMQELKDEYTRRLDVMRQEQADLVRHFIEQREQREKEDIRNKLNA